MDPTTTIQSVLIPTESYYRTVDVQITGDTITAIGTDLTPVGTCIDGRNKLLLPGLINTHTHSTEVWQRGRILPYPLELWLADLHAHPQLTLEQVRLSSLSTALDTLKSGGTSVLDHLALLPGQEIETVATAAQAYRDIGIRAFIGPLIQDEPDSFGVPRGRQALSTQPFYRSTADVLGLMRHIIKTFHQPDQGISIVVAPTGPQLCSDQLFEGCIELSQEFELCRHTHLLETQAQRLLGYEKYGCSSVEHLDRLGYLGPQTSLAHCVWLEDPDIRILAQTQASVVHNPLSNLRLGSGIAPVLKYRQAGINVCFGCDGAASNDAQDLLEAIKIGSLVHNVTDFEYRHWLTPRQSVEMAAQGGAIALHLGDQLGSLTVGKQADMVLYDLTNLSFLPSYDPVNMLIWGRPNHVVDSLWVRGRQLIADSKLLTLDEEAFRATFLSYQYGCSESTTTQETLEHHYRSIMTLQ